MLEIFNFYIGVVSNLFNRVLNGFQITNGLGFGTFLLGCGIFVIFINILKFINTDHGLDTIVSYRKSKSENNPYVRAKHISYGVHEKGHAYGGKHSRGR